MAFDPTLPFEVVEEPEKRKGGFDPNASFEVENVPTSDPNRSPSLFFKRQDASVTELNPDGTMPAGQFDPSKPFEVEQAPQPQPQDGGGYLTLAARSPFEASAQMLTGVQRMRDMPFLAEDIQQPSPVERRAGIADVTQTLRKALPVDPEVEQSGAGQFIQGIGQIGTQVAAAAATGPLAPLTLAASGAGQLFEEGYQDQIRSGANEETAKENAWKYTASSLPLEYLGDAWWWAACFVGFQKIFD